MIEEKIKGDITDFLSLFLEDHPNMNFRIEFDEIRDKFLVSYHFTEGVDDEDLVWDHLSNLHAVLEERFGDNSPLFCEDNRLFKLSDKAVIINPPVVFREIFSYSEGAMRSSHLSYNLYDGDYTMDFYGEIKEYSYAA